MDTLDAIATRRSTRRFKDERVEDGLLGRVITAGRQAPSGGNCQANHFIVIRNRQILGELAAAVREEFARMEAGPDTYKSLAASIKASKRGSYVFHYNAPVLIVVANKAGAGNAMADSVAAVENMMLAANDLDLGSCYINQLHWLADNERILEFLRGLGLGEDETVCAAVALGLPDTDDGMPRRDGLKIVGNKVTYCD